MKGAVSSKFTTLPPEVRWHVGSFLEPIDQENLMLTNKEFVNDGYRKFSLDTDILERGLVAAPAGSAKPFAPRLREVLARRQRVHRLKICENKDNSFFQHPELPVIFQDFVKHNGQIEHVHLCFGKMGSRISAAETALWFTPERLKSVKDILESSQSQTLSFINLERIGVNRELFSCLPGVSRIKTLEFRNCEITALDLSCFSSLTHLSLSNVLMSFPVMDGLGGHEQLTSLDMSIIFTDRQYIFPRLLASFPKLQSLSLVCPIELNQYFPAQPFPEHLTELSFGLVVQETRQQCLTWAAASLQRLTLNNLSSPLHLPVLPELRHLTWNFSEAYAEKTAKFAIWMGDFRHRLPKLRTIIVQGGKWDINSLPDGGREELDREKSILNKHYTRLVFKE